MLELLLVPACFVVAGAVGRRLGTPDRVAGGLVAVGGSHLLAFLVSDTAQHLDGLAAASAHLASQLLFLAGFVGLVWLAACYPNSAPPPRLMAAAAVMGIAGPLVAALSAPTPAIVSNDGRRLGPVAHVLPTALASVAVAPLLLLPLIAVTVFVVRFRLADARGRAAMRWPVIGTVALLVSVLAGVATPAAHQALGTAVFLSTAPLLPVALALGPVAARLSALDTDLVAARAALDNPARTSDRPASLRRLTPREHDVLREMARGASNPVIARSLHLSLSSVEKHATSIFRKLDLAEGPEVHRRVAAVVTYRDALQLEPDAEGNTSR